MTAVAYCMRDLHGSGNTPPGAVCVPQTSGGCGVPHEAKKTDTGRWVIECDLCAPRLIARTYGFSSDAAGVPLTPDEVRANELAERDGKAAQSSVMAAMTEAFVHAIQQAGTREWIDREIQRRLAGPGHRLRLQVDRNRQVLIPGAGREQGRVRGGRGADAAHPRWRVR